MSALARRLDDDCYTRAANDADFNGGPWTRTKYTYVANRLDTVNSPVLRDYEYNTEGQVIADGTGKAFAWNGADRITSVIGVADYAYDGLGKRYRTTKAGVDEYTISSRAGTMLYSYKPATNESTDYVYVGRMPIAQVESNPSPQPPTVTYLHSDLLSSPIQSTSALGVHLTVEQYAPYGSKLNGVSGKLGYTGHVNDSDTGLTYMQARFYDAQVGRFLSPDPASFNARRPFTFNRYAYVNNNPYKYTDPNGEFAVPVHWAITFFASRAAGNSLGDSVRYANRAWQADFEAGSQGTSKEAVARHAMRTRGQSIESARAMNAALVSNAVASGDRGLAAHAIQDRHAASHANFALWEGFRKLGLWGTLKHVLTDTFPSLGALSNAYDDTKEMFENASDSDDPDSDSAGVPDPSKDPILRHQHPCNHSYVLCTSDWDGPGNKSAQ
jgi:RHS repeat-associated protein